MTDTLAAASAVPTITQVLTNQPGPLTTQGGARAFGAHPGIIQNAASKCGLRAC